SRERFDYAGVQRAIDAGEADPVWQLLREVGELRMQRERRRGGVSLPLPDQEIRADGEGWRLEFRAREPVEDWNEQVSLLTGTAAAHLMTLHGVGLLRTLPEADPHALERLRRTARALRIDWPRDRPYPDFIRSLDPRDPAYVAMLVSATSVLRGAGYAASEGALPEHPMHAALASPTPIAPRPCDGWWIATRASCAWRCAPARRRPPGCWRHCRACHGPWPNRT